MDNNHWNGVEFVSYQFEIESLWKRHAKGILLVCQRITKDTDLALDLRQEVFLKVARRIHTYQGDAHIFTWLYKIAFHTCMDHVRRCRANDRSVCDPGHFSYMAYPAQESENVNTVRHDLDGILADCTPLGRLLLELHHGEGFTLYEISQMLGVSKSSIYKRMVAAMQSIRKVY